MFSGGGGGFFVFVFCLLGAAPAAYGVSQARGPIGAIAANKVSEPCLRSTPQLTAMPDPLSTEQGQGLNLHPQECKSDSFPLSYNGNSKNVNP